MLMCSFEFQFTHPGRGATRRYRYRWCRASFNSRTPGGVRLQVTPPFGRGIRVSIHAPREGCDARQIHQGAGDGVSIHAPREGCDEIFNNCRGKIAVSIHAPREGCDLTSGEVNAAEHRFNSRTPGGVRPSTAMRSRVLSLFQFTHPGRGATSPDRSEASSASRFNSRTPGGVRLARVLSDEIPAYVSIHAPREGCDSPYRSRIVWSAMFQFTHPGRGATLCDDWLPSCSRFQFTHPGRGATKTVDVPAWAGKKFQFTHPGRGATEGGDVVDVRSGKFQFTHPGRGATFSWSAVKRSSRVSIHAPREGCDQRSNHAIRTASSFQFTHPGRGATKAGEDAMEGWHKFQFTHPGRGATLPRSPQ